MNLRQGAAKGQSVDAARLRTRAFSTQAVARDAVRTRRGPARRCPSRSSDRAAAQAKARLPLVTVPDPDRLGHEARMGAAYGAPAERRGLHARGVRRSVSRRHPPVSRGAHGRHRSALAALSDVAAARPTSSKKAKSSPVASDAITDLCGSTRSCQRNFAGRHVDGRCCRLTRDASIPCGERGEFHTCAVAGPMFSRRIDVTVGQTVERDGFVFADLEMAKVRLKPDAKRQPRGFRMRNPHPPDLP